MRRFTADTTDSEVALALIQHFLHIATVPITPLLPCAHTRYTHSIDPDLRHEEIHCHDCEASIYIPLTIAGYLDLRIGSPLVRDALTRAQTPHLFPYFTRYNNVRY